jgi:polyisoprenoid-binding protein YceI
MKKYYFLVALALVAGNQLVGQQHLVAAMSTITFKIKNLGFIVEGSFSGLKGDIRFNKAKPAESSFTASVEANTINTGIGARDRHLKNENYLSVEKFPMISFVSQSVTTANSGEFMISGKLTIRDKAKLISFPFTTREEKEGTRFMGSFTINRRDFDVGGPSFSMSDNLTIFLSLFAD